RRARRGRGRTASHGSLRRRHVLRDRQAPTQLEPTASAGGNVTWSGTEHRAGPLPRLLVPPPLSATGRRECSSLTRAVTLAVTPSPAEPIAARDRSAHSR